MSGKVTTGEEEERSSAEQQTLVWTVSVEDLDPMKSSLFSDRNQEVNCEILIAVFSFFFNFNLPNNREDPVCVCVTLGSS